MKIYFWLALPAILFCQSLLAIEMPLQTLDGKTENLADYRGKWTVVNYWATWCPPCREEMPELQAYHDNHADKDGVVIGINTEEIEPAAIREFLDDYFVTYPNYAEKPAYKTKLGTIPGLPTTYVISPAGTIEARQVGGVTREMIENFIEKWEAKQRSETR